MGVVTSKRALAQRERTRQRKKDLFFAGFNETEQQREFKLWTLTNKDKHKKLKDFK